MGKRAGNAPTLTISVARAAQHGGAKQIRAVRHEFDVEHVVDMSTIFVDHSPMARFPSENTTQRLRPLALDRDGRDRPAPWHQLATILDQRRPPTPFDLGGIRYPSRARDQRESGHHALRVSPPPFSARKTSRGRRFVVVALLPTSSSAAYDPHRTGYHPNLCPTIFAIAVGIDDQTPTAPSRGRCCPENIGIWRSLVAIGLTTISSVWKTPSTRIPRSR